MSRSVTVRPERVIVVAAMPRSGSNLLVRGLGRAGFARDPDAHQWEILLGWSVFHQFLPKPRLLQFRLHVGRLWRWWSVDDRQARRIRTTVRARRAYLDLVANSQTTSDGVLAMKLMWPTYEQGMLRDGLDAHYWGAPVTWIHLCRRDEVRQAVSWWKADQTQQWQSDKLPLATKQRGVRYDADKISAKLSAVERGNRGWRDYFATIGEAPIEVVYEDLDANYEGTMRRLLDRLGKHDVPVPPRQIERQADELNDEWVERFIAERGQP